MDASLIGAFAGLATVAVTVIAMALRWSYVRGHTEARLVALEKSGASSATLHTTVATLAVTVEMLKTAIEKLDRSIEHLAPRAVRPPRATGA